MSRRGGDHKSLRFQNDKEGRRDAASTGGGLLNYFRFAGTGLEHHSQHVYVKANKARMEAVRSVADANETSAAASLRCVACRRSAPLTHPSRVQLPCMHAPCAQRTAARGPPLRSHPRFH